MKKIFVFLVTILFIGCVYADNLNYEVITYTVEIGGESYAATVKFLMGKNEMFLMDEESIVLTDSSGVDYTYDAIGYSSIYPLIDSYNHSYNFKSYIVDETRNRLNEDGYQQFSIDEVKDENFIINFLPKFIKIDNYGKKEFLYYIADERGLEEEDFKNFENEFNSFFSKYYPSPGYGSDNTYTYQTDFRYNISSEIETPNNASVNNNALSASSYLQFALRIKDLLDEATKLSVCTEDDLNAIRTQRNVSFLNLDVNFDAGLSTACYNVLFGDGLGKGNLYERTKEAFSYVAENGDDRDDTGKITLAYYFFQSYYQKGYSFLTGSTMQVEVKDVVRCSIFGEKTAQLLQYGFDVMKFAGVIIGTLLCIIDIFKAVVQKDGEGKKQFAVLIKRLAAIVLLSLTPILVEIIFNFISTVGIDDPICGIR